MLSIKILLDKGGRQALSSGLDKDLDQWVFYPLLFNLMSILLLLKIFKLQKMQSLVKRPILFD